MKNSENLILQLTFPEGALNPTPPEPLQCRICLSEQQETGFVQPCLCSGSMKNVHFRCLSKWIQRTQPASLRKVNSQNQFDCQMCHHKIKFDCSQENQCNKVEQISERISQRKILFVFLLIVTLICLGLIIAASVVLAQSMHQQQQSFSIIILAITVAILFGLLIVLTYVWISDYFTTTRILISKIHNYTFISKRKKRTHSPQRTEVTLLTKTNNSMTSKVSIHPEIVLNISN